MKRRLVGLRPRHNTTYVSQSRTVLAAARDGLIHGQYEEGLFFNETRILSRYRYLIDGEEMIVSALSNVEQHTWLGYYITYPPTFDSLPPDEGSGAVKEVSQETLELRVSRYVGEGMHEDLDLTNYTQKPISFELVLEIDADFADQVETIHQRIQHGKREVHWKDGTQRTVLEFTYHAEHSYNQQGNIGTASILRGVQFEFTNFGSVPGRNEGGIVFRVDLPPHGEWHTCINVIPVWDAKPVRPQYACRSFDPTNAEFDRRKILFLEESAHVESVESETLTADVVESFQQARNDLAALRLFDSDREDRAWITAAGLPMYIALFGRDTLTTSLQSSMLSTQIMDGTLSELSKWQGKEFNHWRDEEPGRMLHEAHTGPLALLNYNPRARYYGSVTTSGFFAAVLAELWHWTGDKEQVRSFLPAARSALEWLKLYADVDQDGFYEYHTKSIQGVKHQAWKDSHDAVVYADGAQAEPPIAASEEQAFVYIAKYLLSEVLWWLDEKDFAKRLYHEAQELKKRFNEKFWMAEANYIPIGLDSNKRLIDSIASNAGHCVAAGIVDESRVERVAERMLADDLFSGWGIRTLSSIHPAYNPYSYHRGSIWPVEQGTFIFGLMRYGLIDPMHRLAKAFFESAALFDYHRLPELYGGHPRDSDHPFPALYLQANSPQSWSASAVLQVIQSLLGLYPYAPLHLLLIDPHLPEWLPELTLSNLHVGKGVCDIRFFRKKDGSSDYEVRDKRGQLHIVRQASPWSLTTGFADRVSDLLNSFL